MSSRPNRQLLLRLISSSVAITLPRFRGVSIKKANPSIKNDVVKLGQKLQIPGKHEIGEQKVPAGAIAVPAQPRKPVKAEYKPYDGPTGIYEVQKGDTLGKIAYSNGINIRQLKELNALSDNNIRIGQKLKIPAAAVKAQQKDAKSDAKAAEAKASRRTLRPR